MNWSRERSRAQDRLSLIRRSLGLSYKRNCCGHVEAVDDDTELLI